MKLMHFIYKAGVNNITPEEYSGFLIKQAPIEERIIGKFGFPANIAYVHFAEAREDDGK